MTASHVSAAREGRVGIVVLHRQEAHNALTLEMIKAIASALSTWRDDPTIHAVVVESVSKRAFCAGGDVRRIRSDAVAGNADSIEQFFSQEYALNLAIQQYPKPYIALIDGLCMGGGIGISVHGQIRVTTQNGLFAMPETNIGMFPDVGATYFLPRLPGRLGLYLGLTGAQMSGADAVHAGLATHFVPHTSLSELRALLPGEGVAAVAQFAQPLPPFGLAPHRDAIDRCFSAATLADLLARLQSEETEWSRETIARIRTMSPSALCWSFAAVRRGANMTLPDALAAELRLTRSVTKHPDFAEGVRAVVIDKDGRPRWRPALIEDVDVEAISRMLGPPSS